MKPLAEFPLEDRRAVRGLLTDIDDTVTTDGKLTSHAYGAMERLHDAGFLVIPVTGGPAGWCDHIARAWPVDAVIGESGAFYFRYDPSSRRLIRRFAYGDLERTKHRRRLDALREEILAKVPGTVVASDQNYRESDLAIDHREYGPDMRDEAISRVVALMTAAGANAQVSSIHINGWFGDYDKLSMSRVLLSECFDIDLDAEVASLVFIGDSLNDAQMFGFFPNAVGTAGVRRFSGRIESEPAYVTKREGGGGFAELAAALIEARRGSADRPVT